MLIVDEGDLVFSFGHEKDTEELLKCLPSIYQSIVSSATLTEDVLALKRLVCIVVKVPHVLVVVYLLLHLSTIASLLLTLPSLPSTMLVFYILDPAQPCNSPTGGIHNHR